MNTQLFQVQDDGTARGTVLPAPGEKTAAQLQIEKNVSQSPRTLGQIQSDKWKSGELEHPAVALGGCMKS